MGVINVPGWLNAELKGIGTVSDKIRRLDQEGYERADIARVLGKRYQHVRNVLEADAKKQSRTKAEIDGDVVANGEVFRLDVGKDGSMHLPVEVLRLMGIAQGGVLSAQLVDGELRLAEPVAALRRVQALLEPLRKKAHQKGGSVVDELIAERRAEAAREVAE